MSMFNEDFYPSPKEVVESMIQDIKYLEYRSILEPSAGSGSILDHVFEIVESRLESKNVYKSDIKYSLECLKNKMYAIEIDPELRSILRDKGYKIIDNDFLSHVNERNYDLILMNPPFSSGAKHLLKAISIANGAEIRCILNKETTENPYSKERQVLLETIKTLDGEIIDLGSCFINADRKTSVEVVLIKLKTKKSKSGFEFNGEEEKDKVGNIEDVLNNKLAKTDLIESYVDQYNRIKDLVKDFIKVKSELDYHVKNFTGDHVFNISKILFDNKTLSPDDLYITYTKILREESWKTVLNKTKINDRVTKKIKKELTTRIEQQGDLAFNLSNIDELFYSLIFNQKDIMKKCIADIFDYLTCYNEKNKLVKESWKTNSHYKVQKKVILPAMTKSDSESKSYSYVSWDHEDNILDLEKAMCFISGKTFDTISNSTSIVHIVKNNSIPFGEVFDSEFFLFKVYKKGTIHLTFKDDYLYQRFNIIACLDKGWLTDEVD